MIAAALYALLASGLMIFVGRRFVTVSESKNQAEAEYRYTLTRLRENAESIALIGGQDEERRNVDQSFRTVLGRWRDISVQALRATVVSQTSGYLAAVLPILLCAPKFLDGSMTLGQVMQAASAFTGGANRLELAGRQLSQICRLVGICSACGFADDLDRHVGGR